MASRRSRRTCSSRPTLRQVEGDGWRVNANSAPDRRSRLALGCCLLARRPVRAGRAVGRSRQRAGLVGQSGRHMAVLCRLDRRSGTLGERAGGPNPCAATATTVAGHDAGGHMGDGLWGAVLLSRDMARASRAIVGGFLGIVGLSRGHPCRRARASRASMVYPAASAGALEADRGGSARDEVSTGSPAQRCYANSLSISIWLTISP